MLFNAPSFRWGCREGRPAGPVSPGRTVSHGTCERSSGLLHGPAARHSNRQRPAASPPATAACEAVEGARFQKDECVVLPRRSRCVAASLGSARHPPPSRTVLDDPPRTLRRRGAKGGIFCGLCHGAHYLRRCRLRRCVGGRQAAFVASARADATMQAAYELIKGVAVDVQLKAVNTAV